MSLYKPEAQAKGFDLLGLSTALRLRSGLGSWSILEFKHVFHCYREALMVVQPPFAAPLRPPVCADVSRLGRFNQFLQPPGAPGLELVHDVFGVPTRSCDDDVNMIGA